MLPISFFFAYNFFLKISQALDELEVAFTHPQAKKTDGNHIFLNFVPTVTVHPCTVAKGEKICLKKIGSVHLKKKDYFNELFCFFPI